MRKLHYLFVIIILLSGVLLTAFAPDLLSMSIILLMCLIAVFGILFNLVPMISFIAGLQAGQRSIGRAVGIQTDSAWVSALSMDRFFGQRSLDELFRDYRDKARVQREMGQIMSDIDEILNEDVLSLLCWQGVAAQIPGTMTGLGILGTFIGLIIGIRDIEFMTVEAAIASVQSILGGIHIAFYTSISGVILSIIFNISQNILRNMMNRELGMFLEDFHKYILPTAKEQKLYRDRKEARKIVELLERIPKNSGFSLTQTQGAAAGASAQGGSEQILMPQVLEGLKNGEFVFYLQPRYELNTRDAVGAEALVRWDHPTLGVLSPSVFIPVLESNGYIAKLDQYIWEEACKTIRAWIDGGARPLPITLNVTKTDILAIDVPGFFADMLKKYRIPPRCLDIEIAENAYLQTHGAIFEVENRLLQAGFRVIVGGFNGDYLALESVEKIGAGILMLDLRYFDIGHRLDSLNQVFEQARKLNMTVFAEGIENMEQLAALRKAGCTEGQGFYFSKPLSLGEFEKKMKEGQNR